MGARYVAFIAPFVALLTAQLLLRANPPAGASWLFWLVTAVVAVASLSPIQAWKQQNAFDYAALASEQLIVVDNVASPYWLGMLLYMDDDAKIFAARQATLIADPQAWLPRLTSEGGIYVSLVDGFATDEGRDRLLDMIHTHNETNIVSMVDATGTIVMYRVTPSP